MKRVLSILLAVVLLNLALPLTVSAAGTDAAATDGLTVTSTSNFFGTRPFPFTIPCLRR